MQQWPHTEKWHSTGGPYPELEAIDVRLFRYIATTARAQEGVRPLSDGEGFVDWFVEGLRMRFAHEIQEGYDPPVVLHSQLVKLLTGGYPVQGPWGYLSLKDGVVLLHSAKKGLTDA